MSNNANFVNVQFKNSTFNVNLNLKIKQIEIYIGKKTFRYY